MGAVAITLLAAIAGTALLLPPPAEAGSSGALAPAARTAAGTSSGTADAASPTARWVAHALAKVASLGRPGPAARPKPSGRGREVAACGGRGMRGVVNLNQASEQELDLLPGVGPAKAKRIAAWRAAHGPFRRLRDLRRVKGFGKKTVRKLTPYLTLDGPTTAVAPE
jgi:competence protein ComEA